MKKVCILVIALAFLSFAPAAPLFAKKKDITIALRATDIIKGQSAFDRVQVIDARKDKSNIGKTFYNLKNVQVLTQDSLAVNVQQLVQSMLQGAEKAGDRQLLVVVNSFELQGKLISTILMDMDFYLGDGNVYTPAGSLDSLYEMYAGGNNLNILFAAANYLITEKVKEVAEMQARPATPGQALTDILTRDERSKKSIAPFQPSARSGVYYTYDQLRNNTPGDTFIHHERYLAGDERMERFYLSSAAKKKDRDLLDIPCLAIYDDGKWYKLYSSYSFRELKLIDGDLYYYEICRGLRLPEYGAGGYAGTGFTPLEIMAIPALTHALYKNQQKTEPQYSDGVFRMRLDPETGLGKKTERIR